MSLHDEGLKFGIDAGAAAVTLATIANWLPAIAALFTAIWTLIRIYETKTVQRLLGRPVQEGVADDED